MRCVHGEALQYACLEFERNAALALPPLFRGLCSHVAPRFTMKLRLDSCSLCTSMEQCSATMLEEHLLCERVY